MTNKTRSYVRTENCYLGEISDYGYAFVPGSSEGVILLDRKTKNLLENPEFLSGCDAERLSFLLGYGLIQNSDDYITGKYRFNKKKAKSISVWLHISNRCNLSCPYCYIVSKDNKSMSKMTADLFLKKLEYTVVKHDLKSVAVRFAGGEPILNQNILSYLIKELYKKFTKKGIPAKLILLTNGTRINKNLISLLNDYQVNVCFSLDGLGKWNDVNRFFGKNIGSFEIIQENLHQLKENNLKPTILTTITEDNLGGISLLNRYLVDSSLHFRYSLYRNNTGHIDSYKKFSDSVFTALDPCYNYYLSAIINDKTVSKHQLCEINLNGKPNFRACNVGISGVTVNHLGEVFFCQAKMDKGTIGNLNDDLTLLEMAWDQSTIPELKEKTVFNYDECKKCQWALVCSGGCPATSYDVNGTGTSASPYCSFFKKMIPRLIEIKAWQLLKKYHNFIKRKGGD